jgi:uncharacterized protein
MRTSRALALLLLAACSSTDPMRWFVLEPVGEAAAATAEPPSVNVGPVVIAESLERPQLLRRVGPHEVDFDDAARWGEPLAHGIARVLAEDLARQLGTERVGLVPGFELPGDGWHVALHVLRFEIEGGEAVMEARWRLTSPGAVQPEVARRSELRSPLQGEETEAAAAALSACVGQLAGEVAAAIGES